METILTQKNTPKYNIGDIVFVIANWRGYTLYNSDISKFHNQFDLEPIDLENNSYCNILNSKVYMFEVNYIKITKYEITYNLICIDECEEITCDEKYIYEEKKEALYNLEKIKYRLKKELCCKCCCSCKCKI